MKKTIRLTESELHRIIKKVISEADPTYRTSNLSNPEEFLPTANPSAAPAAPALNVPRPDVNFPDIPQPKTAPVAAPAPKTIFGVGDSGPEILEFQKYLSTLGYNVGKNGPDGKFGPLTQAAVKDFQSKHGIKVSGRVGPPTKGKLAAAAAAKPMADKANRDPNAEWNQDRRETGNPPTTTTQTDTTQTPKTKPAKTNWGVNPLVANSPGGKAISSIGPSVRASREKAKKDREARQAYYKAHPEQGYGGGGIFSKKG